jgi:hypothetical protein
LNESERLSFHLPPFPGQLASQVLPDHDERVSELTRALVAFKAAVDSGTNLARADFVSSRATGRKEILDDYLPNPMSVLTPDNKLMAPASFDPPPIPPRLGTLKLVTEWLTIPSEGQNLLWLYGHAGCGKSLLARAVASYFRDLGRLGASVFFDKNSPSDPSVVIPTIAHQLGSFDSRLGTAIFEAFSANPSFADVPPPVQFSTLLLDPLFSVQDMHVEGPLVVVLDALDACGTTSDSRKGLLEVMTEGLPKLPACLRVVVTSRLERGITAAFHDRLHIRGQALVLPPSSKTKPKLAITNAAAGDNSTPSPGSELSAPRFSPTSPPPVTASTQTHLHPVLARPPLALASSPYIVPTAAILYDLTCSPSFATDAVTRRPLSPLVLSEQATRPPRAILTLTLASTWPWPPIIISAPRPNAGVCVKDVLERVHAELQVPVSLDELRRAVGDDEDVRERVLACWRNRYRSARDPQTREEQKAQGVKRVDLLMGRVRWSGLSAIDHDRSDTWVLNVV